MSERPGSVRRNARGVSPKEGKEAEKEKGLTVDEAITAVMRECPNAHARTYARAAMTAAVHHGTAGLRCQVRYILSNTQNWRGERARQVRTVLRAYLEEGR